MTNIYITFANYKGEYRVTGGAQYSLEEAFLEAEEQGSRKYHATHEFDGNDYIRQFNIYEKMQEIQNATLLGASDFCVKSYREERAFG